MLLLLLLLIPILLSGIIIIWKISTTNRLELLIPAGSILGLAIFTFFLNLVAFLLKGPIGIIIAYLLVIAAGSIIAWLTRSEFRQIDFPRGKQFIFWVLGTLGWGGFIFWKSAYALIGSDTNLYYSVAHSFVKGNFPLLTPWQPDLPLEYHVGASELLGAFYSFTGLNFQFLHLFFSAIFIFFASQMIIWIIKRCKTIPAFLLVNLAVVVTFISFGFIYITWPVFPIQLPLVNSFSQLILWLRNLPTASPAIEVYGAPINLDALIYFIFHSFGLAIFLSLVTLLVNIRKEIVSWLILFIGLASLALVNESIFVAAFPAIVAGIFFIELREKTLTKNLKKLLLLLSITILVIFSQGGLISAAITKPKNIEESVVIMPNKDDIRDDFNAYHFGQQGSKMLSKKAEWMPLQWFHPGINLFVIATYVLVLLIKEFKLALLLRILFVAGVSSLIGYNIIVPKFLVANGNRFLAFSFLFFSLLLCLALIPLYERVKKSRIKKILFFAAVLWVFIPTVLPPLANLTKNRFGENKLIPRYQQSSEGLLWLKKNAKFDERVMVLDKNAPHPSGQARALVEAGVFAPVFPGEFRAFTVEASPEYIDIAYYLSPASLKKLKVNLLLVDSFFLQTLPDKRKLQLEDNRYFTNIFDNSGYQKEWEKIYKIKNAYLENAEELNGTSAQLLSVISAKGRIYIDNEENFNPSFLRRPLIFSLKDKDIYYLPQSGVYLNVEANINSHHPRDDRNYDYLILGKNTDPKEKCNCQTKLFWQGINDEIYVWKKI